ncbi:cell surface protein SprA [soil metagenome]
MKRQPSFSFKLMMPALAAVLVMLGLAHEPPGASGGAYGELFVPTARDFAALPAVRDTIPERGAVTGTMRDTIPERGAVSGTARSMVEEHPSDTLVVDAPTEAPDLTIGLQPRARTGLVDPDSPFPAIALRRTTDSLGTGDGARRDTSRTAEYFTPRRDGYGAALAERRASGFMLAPGSRWRRVVDLDTLNYEYTIRETVAGQDVRMPADLTLGDYRAARLGVAVQDNFRQIADQRIRRQQTRRGGLGVTFELPGGRSSLFSTIFGPPTVDLRVNGQANVDLGFAYQRNEERAALTGSGGRVDPDFGQDLNLGITGTIGDKLQVNVSYDTRNTFDFENRVRLLYTGYDDDIVQRFEAGNVFLPVQTDLIRGGQSLFGLRTDLRFGGLNLTMVASQQDAETNTINLDGGSQSAPFSINPAAYDDNQHFFLGYYFRNRWDIAHSSPPNILLGPGFGRIVGIDVWKRDAQSTSNQQGNQNQPTNVLALLDLGEPGPGNFVSGAPTRGVLDGANAYLDALGPEAPRPQPAQDQYTEEDLATLRANPNLDVSVAYGLGGSDFEQGPFRLLEEGRDYTFDPVRGYISLTQSLTENDALAVAYQYLDGSNNAVTVGDFGQGGGSGNTTSGSRIVLKLIRNDRPQPPDAAWGLTMRNIYRAGARNLRREGFELQIEYQPSGQSAGRTLPGVTISGQTGQAMTLLQALGLDRLNTDNQAVPDDRIDFQPGYTIEPASGRIIFPYLEPFGRSLEALLTGEPLDGQQPRQVNFSGISREQALNRYVFRELYDRKPADAARLPNITNYRLAGTVSGGVQQVYELGFAVVPQSVTVTSGNIQLREGTDYTVEYATGTLTITNQSFLSAGSNMRIDFERNQFAAIGQKTLLGLRADYVVSRDLALGATFMQLAERPLQDKYRIGEEPLANSIWGLDGRYVAEPRWLTRLVDGIPLIQTRAPSRVELRGEFAQLMPGHPETFAFREARRQLRNEPGGRDFADDELSGISFVDDFEGTENTLSLMIASEWRLPAAPARSDAGVGAGPTTASHLWDPGLPITSPNIATNWRGRTAWYTLNQNQYNTGGFIQRVTGAQGGTPATRAVSIQEIFPGRETGSTRTSDLVSTLDLYFDPRFRGPYNYNENLGSDFANDPRSVWGGMVAPIREGYTDFTARNNIEFVEFIFSTYGGREGTEQVAQDAMLYFDLGQVSEDVIPNRLLNTEDGLLTANLAGSQFDAWGRLATGVQNGDVDLDQNTGRTEDVGLDGLPSSCTNPNGEDYPVCEQNFFAGEFMEQGLGGDFLGQIGDAHPLDQFLAGEDPSGDHFRHFDDDSFFDSANRFENGRATVQERYSRFWAGYECNTSICQRQIAGSSYPGVSRLPNTEDFNNNGALDLVESHFRYAVPMHPDRIRESPFFVNELPQATGEGSWFVMRIPLRTENREAIGGIQDFTLMEAVRVWTQGHDRPTTVRFASLELVGSQWLVSDRAGIVDGDVEVRRLSGGEGEMERRLSGVREASSRDFARLERVAARGAASPGEAQIFVATVNTEKDAGRYVSPPGALVNATRDLAGQRLPQREQSLLLQIQDLTEGQFRGIYKPYTARLDLTRYSNLRMFVHGEGFAARDSVNVVVRIGSNETDDYYEYEQPIYPFDTRRGAVPNPDSVWQTHVPAPGGGTMDRNSVNIVLSALNQLKVERDQIGVAPEIVYEGAGTPPGAPPGARIRIRGNPSIQQISTLVMGVRNAPGGARSAVLDTIEVWFNELRATGYDENSGWSAYGLAQIRLADFADINARVSRTTDGFGELASGLGGRTFASEKAYSLIAGVNMHRFLPERFGWRIPVNVTVQQRTATPRFSPRRGDIRVDELIAQAEDNPNLSLEESQARVQEIRDESQTASYSRSIRVPIQKSGSQSPWLRYTLDGISLAYTNNYEERRSPSQTLFAADRWNGSLSYRLQVPRPVTVRPFWFAEEVPILGVLGALRMNLLPNTVQLSADANRSLTQNQDRLSFSASQDTSLAGVPGRFLTPLRQTHEFGHRRTTEVQYNPFAFLNLRMASRTDQSLNAAGATSFSDTFVRRLDPFTGAVLDSTTYRGFDRPEVFGPGGDGPGWERFGNPNSDSVQVWTSSRLDVLSAPGVFQGLLSGERRARTDRYNSDFTATFQPRLDQISWLRWFRLQPLSYAASFQWQFTPLPGATAFPEPDDPVVALVATNLNVRGGVQMRPVDLFRLMPWYRRLEETQRAADRRAQQARARQTQERQQARNARNGDEETTRPAQTPPRAPAANGTPSQEEEGGGMPGVLRMLILGLTGINDFQVNYNSGVQNRSNAVPNAGFSLFDAIFGDGVPLGYRLGLDRTINRNLDGFGDAELLRQLQPQDFFNDNQSLDFRTNLQFTSNFRADLSWRTAWRSQDVFTYPNFGDQDFSPQLTRAGGGEANVIALGGSFRQFVERQTERLRSDAAAGQEGGIHTDALTSNTLVEDFRSTFANSGGAFGPRGFLAIPIPNWTITYTGASNWPFINRIAQQVQITHAYSAVYNMDYRSNAAAGTPASLQLPVPSSTGGTQNVSLLSTTPELQGNTARITERFAPLIGANVTIRGGLQAQLAWNRSNNYALTAASGAVSQGESNEITMRVSFAKTGVRLPIPFLGGRRLNNNLRFTLAVSQSESSDRTLYLRENVGRLFADPLAEISDGQPQGFSRFSVEPRFSYTLSNQVTFDVFVQYENTESQSSRIPTVSRLNGGVNFRVSFAN